MKTFITPHGIKLVFTAYQTQRLVGHNETRTAVVVEVYEKLENSLAFMTQGLSMCHPTDTFNAKRGLRQALTSAIGGFQPDFIPDILRRSIYEEVLGWPV